MVSYVRLMTARWYAKQPMRYRMNRRKMSFKFEYKFLEDELEH